MAKNYEEQIEKLKNQHGPPNPPPNTINKFVQQVPVDPSKLVEQIEKRKFLFSKKVNENILSINPTEYTCT